VGDNWLDQWDKEKARPKPEPIMGPKMLKAWLVCKKLYMANCHQGITKEGGSMMDDEVFIKTPAGKYALACHVAESGSVHAGELRPESFNATAFYAAIRRDGNTLIQVGPGETELEPSEALSFAHWLIQNYSVSLKV